MSESPTSNAKICFIAAESTDTADRTQCDEQGNTVMQQLSALLSVQTPPGRVLFDPLAFLFEI
jgi:hypothetical protein